MSTLAFRPAWPVEGGNGSSVRHARVSEIWPGAYLGRCLHCGSNILAEKRAPRCDACEVNRLEAIEEAAVDQAIAGRLEAATEAGLRERTLRALRTITERYVQIAGSGDRGHWDPDTEPEVIEARAIIALGDA